ncbi:MAG TPA: hypothetical protein VFG04_01085, partial [Planctomycetaceae bacterium]|nr:hypothetical protein [Planctomycetaceae bacterium]
MGDSTDTLPSSTALAPALQDAHAAEVPSADRPAPNKPAAPSVVAPGLDETVKSHFWLTRTDQVIFGLLSVAALALLAVYWVRLSNWGTRTVEIERLPARQYEFRIDANSAT